MGSCGLVNLDQPIFDKCYDKYLNSICTKMEKTYGQLTIL